MAGRLPIVSEALAKRWGLTERTVRAVACPHAVHAARVKQARLWLRGISTHNKISGECVPDLTCCTQTLGVNVARAGSVAKVECADHETKMEHLRNVTYRAAMEACRC